MRRRLHVIDTAKHPTFEGETTVEGPWVDRVVGLDEVRADIAMMRTPDGLASHKTRRRTRWGYDASGEIAQYEDMIGLAERLT